MSLLNAPDFSRLSNAEVARLYNETRNLAAQEKYGVADEIGPQTQKSRYHIAPDNSVCDCGDPASHYPQTEGKKYIHAQGYVATMEAGEQIELTEEQRQIRFYESMPDSDVARLSDEDQFALEEWRDARIESLCAEFIQKCPRYYQTDENKLALVDYLSRKYLAVRCVDDEVESTLRLLLQRGVFTTENLIDSFDALYKSGRLEAKPGIAKPLNANELRRLSALASSCQSDRDYETVLQEFLRSSGINLSWREAVLDSVYSSVVEKAVLWIWEQAQDSYTPSAERRAAIRKYLAGRFPTAKLLNAAWLAVQRQEEREGLREEEKPVHRSADESKLEQAQALANAIAQESFRGI